MTRLEKIKTMSIDELVEWLDDVGSFDNAPWTEWWDNTYCRRCEAVRAKYVGDDEEHDFAFCELNDNCRFFEDRADVPSCKEIVKMWLERDVDEI